MKTATAPLPPLRSVKVLDQLRERIRYLHYSLRTEQAYVNWVRAFIRFHGVRHPATLGSSEVEAFLSWLANERKVSVSTHRQALAALLFFYGKVLCTDLPWLQEIGRPRPSRRLPVVLTPDEVVRILGFLEGEHRLFAQLLYGTGMRISEGLQLRVKDLDFDHGTIIVREGKGSKDRALMLPESLAPSLREQLSRARAWWLKDQAEGRSGVALPDALERKYPRAGHSWPLLLMELHMNPFKGRHFQRDIILWAVRWYCKYGISYRELQEMLAERGVNVDHSTIYRWVQRYAPEMEKRLRWYWRNPSDLCPWHMDETYVKVNGRWAYLYRAVDSRGRTVDFYLSSRRNSKAAYRFLGKILNNVKKWQIPRFINTDKAPAYGRALALLKREGRCPSDVEHRQIKYRNNVIECDHGKLKRIIGATLGFKSMKTAYATIKGIEVMRALRKGQASAFYYGDPLGEMRLVSRVFERHCCKVSDEAAFCLIQRPYIFNTSVIIGASAPYTFSSEHKRLPK
nr:IntI1 [Salmonella enterica subsp. enterica serovar Corvallis]